MTFVYPIGALFIGGDKTFYHKDLKGKKKVQHGLHKGPYKRLEKHAS